MESADGRFVIPATGGATRAGVRGWARWMRVFSACGLAVALAGVSSCGGAQRSAGGIARQCEVAHNLTGDDEVNGRIDRLTDGWLVALRLRVRVSATNQVLEVRGLGHVSGEGTARACRVLESNGDPGQPRFDDALCLDEFESIIDLVRAAEAAVQPGATMVQEVRLNPSRRRRVRSRVGLDASGFQERAEITRDRAGRAVRIVRATTRGGREEIVVTFPDGSDGRCVPAE